MRTQSPTSKLLRRLGFSSLTVLAAAILTDLVAPSTALAACCTLKSGATPNENSIASLYAIVFYMSIVVFVVVIGFLLYSVYRYRAHKYPVAQQIHGHAKLEIGLTAASFGILIVISVLTFVKLPGIVNPPNSDASASSVLSASLTAPNPPNGQKLTVCVSGRQFIWRYVYGANCNKSSWEGRLPYSYQEMVVPAGEVVSLVIQSNDVVHSWWVPALGGKVDAVPGFTTYAWFKALHANELYHGECAQLCGREHAFMTALVKVVTPTQFVSWLKNQEAIIKTQNDEVAPARQELTKLGALTSSGTF